MNAKSLENCGKQELYKSRELKTIVRYKKKCQNDWNKKNRYKKKLDTYQAIWGEKVGEEILRHELALKFGSKCTLRTNNRREKMALYDIQCPNGHVAVYDGEGKKGAGFYCAVCGHSELDVDIIGDEEMMNDQLRRRIIR